MRCSLVSSLDPEGSSALATRQMLPNGPSHCGLATSTGHTVTAAMRMDIWECPPGFLYAEAHLHQEGGAGSSSDLSTTSLQT